MTTWLVMFKNSIPEFITAAIVYCLGIDAPPNLDCFLFVGYSVLLRIIWNISILIHGLGHVTLTTILDRDRRFFNIINILEHRSISDIWRSSIPFSPIFLPFDRDAECPWVSVGRFTPVAIRVKAIGGILFNLIAVGLVAMALPFGELLRIDMAIDPAIERFLINTFVGANLLVIFSSRSDLLATIAGEAQCFNCGNFGFVGKRLPQDGSDLLPARVIDIFQTMGCETEIRGEQAGGGMVFARDARFLMPQAKLRQRFSKADPLRTEQVKFVGTKVINHKRQNLTQSLEAAFAPVRRKAIRAGDRAVDAAIVGAWHYRYATSSPPAIVETHWHEWMPARTANVWRVEGGKWLCDRQTVNHRITHNGDFDAWVLFGEPIANADLGLWLERVLHTPNSTLGDSPKIAGMMDLLITQGMWDASLRLAYQLTVADAIEEAFDGKSPTKSAPNTSPSELEIQDWAAIVEGIFITHQDRLLLPGATSMVELATPHVHQLELAILHAFDRHRTIGKWTESKQSAFAKTAVHAFFYYNLYQATKVFMSRAKGSFGLVTASTLNEDSIVLSAWGQPIVTGFNVRDNYTIYASEPAAVDAVLADIPRSYRLDLDQKAGEIAWVGVDRVTIYAMQADRELLGSELEQRWVPFQGNPYIVPPAKSAKDPVEHDIQAIPQVLQSIAATWRDATSFNRHSADYFAELLIEKAKNWERRHQATIELNVDRTAGDRDLDLLITGVENSLWLGERFAQDLTSIFPALKVKALSANQVLRKLQSDSNRLHLGKNSIVLAISHSGQTFPTLQATHAFEQLRHQAKIGELFIMTGEICSMMGTAIGQYYYPAASFTQRIFIDGSGRHTAEPSTVAVAAAHATLTQLLLHLTKRLIRSFPDRDGALGITLSASNLKTLVRIQADFVDRCVVPILGTTPSGARIDSSVHHQLIGSGRKWALHLTETPLAWGIHALYVLLTVGFQVPLVQTLVRALFALADLSVPEWLLPSIVLADIIIYIFGTWLLWTLGLRYFQHRPLLARMGKRLLIVGDVPWVHQLLEVYVSKLLSLSYGIASLDVDGANPQDHLLHLFGHRVVRGTLVFLGIPDGRRDKLQHERESAAIVTGKQASGIRNFSTGAEIIGIGHNPTIAEQGFQSTIVLPSDLTDRVAASGSDVLEDLRESRFSSFERLLASYVFFWALSKKVASLPLLRYQHWKSQSRTRTMTTAAPVSRAATNLLDR